MILEFTEKDHKYTSKNDRLNTRWISATSFIGLFKPKFDAVQVSIACSKKKSSKWYGLSPEKIREIWKGETKRSTDTGSLFHNRKEEELVSQDVIVYEDITLPVIPPVYEEEVKISRDQVLEPGVYPEHIIYLKSAGICGQADKVTVYDNLVDISDYKTNKKIEDAYVNGRGESEKMLGPCSHLDHCELNHYALQLSLYMYMILKHNHYLDPGNLTIEHARFEVESEDEYGFPIIARDQAGNPIVSDIEIIPVPFMRKEIVNMIKYHKQYGKEQS